MIKSKIFLAIAPRFGIHTGADYDLDQKAFRRAAAAELNMTPMELARATPELLEQHGPALRRLWRETMRANDEKIRKATIIVPEHYGQGSSLSRDNKSYVAAAAAAAIITISAG